VIQNDASRLDLKVRTMFKTPGLISHGIAALMPFGNYTYGLDNVDCGKESHAQATGKESMCASLRTKAKMISASF